MQLYWFNKKSISVIFVSLTLIIDKLFVYICDIADYFLRTFQSKVTFFRQHLNEANDAKDVG